MSDTNGGRVPAERPRLRVPAGSSAERVGNLTVDSVSNFVARLGISQPNLLSGTSYTFTPITRLNQLMEWAYRGSWVVGAAVDIPADDMTRTGIEITGETNPADIQELNTAINSLCMWQSMNEEIKWSRLYGGAIMVMMIDGQRLDAPLIPERVPEGGLRGFVVLDRWMLQPSYNDLITDYGPDFGMPQFYDVVTYSPFMQGERIHYSRVMRMDGLTLPYRQRLAENGWGMSVIERLYDRLLAFDSGTMGAAQLLFKAYLRTYKAKNFRALVSMGGDAHEHFMRAMDLMRMLQASEGLTVIDAEDEFETHTYTFAGLSETLLMLGQQLSGALGIPLVRLFGQSPVGLNSTGDSDWELYESLINATQELRVRRPLTWILRVLWQSVLGKQPAKGWGFTFRPLRKLSEMQKGELAQRDADTIKLAHDGGIITTSIALKELKQSSIVTGRFTNISDSDIKDSEEAPPPWEEQEPMPGMPGVPGAKPGGAGGTPGAKPPAPTLKAVPDNDAAD
jgi:uncharacterized protein